MDGNDSHRRQSNHWNETRNAADLMHAGCLKAGCPGRAQAGLCHMMLTNSECDAFAAEGGRFARTSDADWWLR